MAEETRYVLREDGNVQYDPKYNAYKVKIGTDCYLVPSVTIITTRTIGRVDSITHIANEPTQPEKSKRHHLISKKRAQEFADVWNKKYVHQPVDVEIHMGLTTGTVRVYKRAAISYGIKLKKMIQG